MGESSKVIPIEARKSQESRRIPPGGPDYGEELMTRPDLSFPSLDRMTREEFDRFRPLQLAYEQKQSEQMIWTLKQTELIAQPFGLSQLDHGLQMAYLARRDGASDEVIFAALCHDMGKICNYHSHPEVAAEAIRPYVSDVPYHLVRTHQDFQVYHARGLGPHLAKVREVHSGQPWFDAAVQFSEWDNAAFDPGLVVPGLADYVDLVRQMCAKPRKASPVSGG